VNADSAADELGTLDLLTSLVDKSLIVASLSSPEPRFLLLESSLHYARERLGSREDSSAIARRHAEYYLMKAERAAEARDDLEIPQWLPPLAADLDNFRAVLTSAINHPDYNARLAARLICALNTVSSWFGLHTDGVRWAETVLTSGSEDLGLDLEADLRCALARFYLTTGPLTAALASAEHTTSLYSELGDRRNVAWTRLTYGTAAHWLGQHDDASLAYERALETGRELNDCRLIARLLWRQGQLATDLETRAALLTEAGSIFKRLGDEPGWLLVLDALAEVAFLRGDVAKALVCAHGVLAQGNSSTIRRVRRRFGPTLQVTALSWAG